MGHGLRKKVGHICSPEPRLKRGSRMAKSNDSATAVGQNAQQGLRNQPPINRHAPPTEETGLEQTGSGRVLGPMKETRAEEIDDEEENLPKLVVADKPVVNNVNLDEIEKHPVVAKEDACEKEKEKETPKINQERRNKVRSWKEMREEPRTANGQVRNADRPCYIPEMADKTDGIRVTSIVCKR
ncbi:hypothetical protein HAX54_000096 [Datura stramonium]|uniref:Uncharacterized protein n=1 Tax=Datura stramonium TaxID=4076 RepID=A0ABS8RHH2_DATST|nr:hypothetical protein [Datura stramonium]